MNPKPFDSQSHLGLGDRVSSKIVETETLRGLIRTFPREDAVVMAHGTFDLVHPGHLRHLAFAKSRGDILVVSITTDEHVQKANMRPYVPQELRALNLAALELVDYVIVDGNPEPLRLLDSLRPDIFVKGYEYGQSVLPEKTQREKETVEAYGGQIIFSPGDYVLSSSVLIENDPPRIGLEKLLTLMEVEGLTFQNLLGSLQEAESLTVSIVGDLIIDSLTTVSVIGGQRKTPTPSVRVEGHQKFVGGAGIVAKHLAMAGAQVHFHTIVGDDELGHYALEDLARSGVKVSADISENRPTTHKNAVVADGYRLLRIDVVDNKTIDEYARERMSSALADDDTQVVIFSDFRHGIFNRDTIPTFLRRVPRGAFTVADSQLASRWGNILDFRGCDLITPNEQEVRFALGDQDSVIRPLGSRLYEAAGCRILMLKLGSRGMITFRDPTLESERRSFFAVDALSRGPVVDAVGSGDALLAYSTITQMTTGNEVIASIVGTIAAGLACEQEGNVPIAPAAVAERIMELEKASNYSS